MRSALATPRCSVVIPAFNEERYLPALLDSIDAARAAYRSAGDIEVITGPRCSRSP